jgi:outer membrane protein OmpA-like peptidoglycan-associated protein/Tol biopolymer transport system component
MILFLKTRKKYVLQDISKQLIKKKHMNKFFLSLALLAVFVTPALAQKSNKETKGDKYYSFYSFQKAIDYYNQVNPLSTDGKRKLADSYHKLGNNTKAEEVFAGFINESSATPKDYYNYSSILRINGKIDEANKWMEKFTQTNPSDLRTKSFESTSKELANLQKNDGRYKIQHLEINSSEQDFGTSYYGNKIVFASSRGASQWVKRSYNWNQKPFLNLYQADVKGNQLENPVSFNKKINKKMHEGPASFSNSGKFMAFTKNNYSGKSKEGIIKLQIFFSSLEEGKWTSSQAFKLNSAEHSVGHPCLSADGKSMYFASDMPGGIGGVDIYKIERNAAGVWGEAKNLGKNINTEGNEMFPFFEEKSQTLFFASNGHFGLGGLDVFMANLNGSDFQNCLNLGTPINTKDDDFSLVIDDKMKQGYFSSNRSGGKGDDDIYSFELLKPYQIVKTIVGVAKDKSGKKLTGVTVKLMDESGKEVKSAQTGEDGAYSFAAEENKKYTLSGSKEKYFDGKNNANTMGPEEVVTADLDLEQDPGLSLLALVTDSKTKQALEGVKVTITESKAATPFANYVTPATGDYRKPLTQNKIGDKLYYTIKLEKPEYLTKTLVFEKTIDKQGEIKIHESLDMSLSKLEVGGDLAKLININPIYFDLNKFNIRPDAAVELNKIIAIMNEYPTMEIELGSHTDCRASYAYNENLSDKRAKSSAAFIKKAISKPERIYGKGYGESKLINECACEGTTKAECTEEQHQKNRRTEFIIKKM